MFCNYAEMQGHIHMCLHMTIEIISRSMISAPFSAQYLYQKDFTVKRKSNVLKAKFSPLEGNLRKLPQ